MLRVPSWQCSAEEYAKFEAKNLTIALFVTGEYPPTGSQPLKLKRTSSFLILLLTLTVSHRLCR